MQELEMVSKIQSLRKERDAIILAHNYQPSEVQEIADIVGDSFALSRAAAKIDKQVIVFCGVHFMAESAKILSPEKTVLLPAPDAGCPLADCITPQALSQMKAEHPEAAVVCYINTSASVKAESDVCCTSSNAVKIVSSLDCGEVLFVPDSNLGAYVAARVPDKRIIRWPGHCIVHSRITVQDVMAAKAALPGAKLLMHPEVSPEAVAYADFIGSTAAIIKYARESKDQEFIIGTEMGILESLKGSNPSKRFYLLNQRLLCVNMKKTTLTQICRCLENMDGEVTVDEETRLKAYSCLKKMMEISAVGAL